MATSFSDGAPSFHERGCGDRVCENVMFCEEDSSTRLEFLNGLIITIIYILLIHYFLDFNASLIFVFLFFNVTLGSY
jgi:hypothetical protein